MSGPESDGEFVHYSDTENEERADDDVQSTRMISRQLSLLLSCNSSFIWTNPFICIQFLLFNVLCEPEVLSIPHPSNLVLSPPGDYLF